MQKQLKFADLKNDKQREEWLEANEQKYLLLDTTFFRAYGTPKLPDGTYFVTLKTKRKVFNPNYYNSEGEPMFNVKFSNYRMYIVKTDEHAGEEYVEETSKSQAINKLRELRTK
jgi:hypothetical protein